MLDSKRVDTARNAVLKRERSNTDIVAKKMSELRSALLNPPALPALVWAQLAKFTALQPFADISLAVADEDFDRLSSALGFHNGLFLMSRHLRHAYNEIDANRSIAAGNVFGEKVALLLASGWDSDAADVLRPLFSNQSSFKAMLGHDIKPVEAKVLGWFAMLSARTALDVGGEVKVNFDPKILPIWAMFMQKWDDPDPAAVRNVALACHEQLIAKAMIPEAKRPEFAEDSILFFDYDLRALNVLRAFKGLAPVEVETYCPPMPPLGKIPFARDDVFWPVYLDVCARLGIEPRFQDRDYVNVSLNWETGLVEGT